MQGTSAAAGGNFHDDSGWKRRVSLQGEKEYQETTAIVTKRSCRGMQLTDRGELTR